ncbi:MAG: hypothetical protein SFT92_08485 [Rickettsiales bacterium]|nr:hypothetical protein [Rickettsiales bacterium]
MFLTLKSDLSPATLARIKDAISDAVWDGHDKSFMLNADQLDALEFAAHCRLDALIAGADSSAQNVARQAEERFKAVCGPGIASARLAEGMVQRVLEQSEFKGCVQKTAGRWS